MKKNNKKWMFLIGMVLLLLIWNQELILLIGVKIQSFTLENSLIKFEALTRMNFSRLWILVNEELPRVLIRTILGIIVKWVLVAVGFPI